MVTMAWRNSLRVMSHSCPDPGSDRSTACWAAPSPGWLPDPQQVWQ